MKANKEHGQENDKIYENLFNEQEVFRWNMVAVDANNKESFFLLFLRLFFHSLNSYSHFRTFYCNFTFMTHLSHFLGKNSRQVGFREQQLFSFSVLSP